MKSSFHQRLVEAVNSPIEYHNQYYSSLTYDNSVDNIEVLINLMFCSKTKLSLKEIRRIREEIFSHPDYSTNLEYQYFTTMACAELNRDHANYSDATSYFSHMLEIATFMDDSDKILTAFIGLASVYNEMFESDKSLEYIEKAISMMSHIDDPLLVARTFYTYAAILYERKEYEKGVHAAERAVLNYSDIGDREKNLSYTMTQLMYVRLLYLTNSNKKANTIMTELIPKAEKYKHLEGLQLLQETVAEYYEQIGDYEKALYYQKRFSEVLKEREKDKIKSFNYKGSKQVDSLKSLLERNESLKQRVADLYNQISYQNTEETVTVASFEDVQKALDGDEFDIYFQLIWSELEKRYVKAEALTRWIKPDGSIITPNHFVKYIEESELSARFLQILINRSLVFVEKLKDKGIEDLTICINISPYQLREINIISLLESACIRHHIKPSSIELEITERLVLEKDVTVLDRIFKLKERGFKLSMDDFGTGFSSLESLRTLNLDTVKLDRSLIKDVHGDEKAIKLLRGVIHLLLDLKYHVVCEGVELQEDVELLTTLGCHLFQGYFYNRPANMDEVLGRFQSI